MAVSTDIPTDVPAENASDSTEVHNDDTASVPVQPDSDGSGPVETTDGEHLDFLAISDEVEPDRSEEVSALLGRSLSSDNEEKVMVPDQDVVDEKDEVKEDAARVDGSDAEDYEDEVVSALDAFLDVPDNRPVPAPDVYSEICAGDQPASGYELKSILESLKETAAACQYISTKIDAVSNDTDGLIKQVNSISLNHELLAAEMESISSDSNSKSMLSKTFLTISSAIVLLLVMFQIYMFVSLINTQRLQNAAGSSVLDKISGLNTKMADYDKNLTKALEKSAQQEHAQPIPAAAEKTAHDTGVKSESGPAPVTPVLERLNKLRNGHPEKKLIRKETGDWFVYDKKNNECISDIEVIEALNQAYRKIGRSTSVTVPMPSHNALCILKPDGKGGTQVVMTKDFLP